jgi:hypothetical protein
LQHQVFLEDEGFITRFRDLTRLKGLDEVPRVQRRALSRSLAHYREDYPERDEAMARAYLSGIYTRGRDFFGVHYMTVSRAVRKLESTVDA